MAVRRIAVLSSAVLLAGLAISQAVAAGGGQEALIERAAAAPYRALLLRQAGALCASLTPAAEAGMVAQSAPGSSCEAAVSAVFAQAAPSSVPRTAAESLRAIPHHLVVAGSRASGSFELLTETTAADGRVHVAFRGDVRLALEEQGGRWLVSSQALLAAVPECSPAGQGGCPAGPRQVAFMLGASGAVTLSAAIPVPRAVLHAGAKVKAAFDAGRTVLLQSGCLACHRIGSAGNRRPGPNLTTVGSRLTASQIDHAIVDATAPMPSFSHLPKQRLRELVRFLSLMRR